MYKIYRYTFPNGKIYIGVTKNTIQYRKDCGYQHNKRLTEAIRNTGFANVKVDILLETEDQKEAFEKEKWFINQEHATDSDIGYNISNGGKNTFEGLKHTADYKAKMSQLYKGRSLSDETINKIKAKQKDVKPVLSLNADGDVIKEYDSLGNAAKDVGGYKSNISRACKSKRPYKELYWCYSSRQGGDDR